MEDTRIIDLYLERDESAIRFTMEKYGTRLRELANSILEDLTAAEECENDTYLAAWSAIPPHEPRNYLLNFLKRITRHISLDRCRARNRLKRSAHLVELTQEMEQCISAPEDVENQSEALALAGSISTFLRSLPEEQRNVFLRRYWYMDSICAIAERFDITQSKVKTTLFRSRNALRKYLEKEGYTV